MCDTKTNQTFKSQHKAMNEIPFTCILFVTAIWSEWSQNHSVQPACREWGDPCDRPGALPSWRNHYWQTPRWWSPQVGLDNILLCCTIKQLASQNVSVRYGFLSLPAPSDLWYRLQVWMDFYSKEMATSHFLPPLMMLSTLWKMTMLELSWQTQSS